MISPSQVAIFCPSGLKKFKLQLFERIGKHIEKAGGRMVRDDERRLLDLPDEIVPIVGCTPALRPIIDGWKARGRNFCYWDRGYFFRIFATWLPRGDAGGMYRWHLNSFQLQKIRDVPPDRFNARKPPVIPWQKGGRHILIAAPTPTYSLFHHTERWTDLMVDALARVTDRPLMIRGKESKRPLGEDLKGAHALVAHASNAAVEAVIMGCPAFVHSDSAASLLGNIDIAKIETPVYAERQPWLNSLSYSQYTEKELVDGTLWELLT